MRLLRLSNASFTFSKENAPSRNSLRKQSSNVELNQWRKFGYMLENPGNILVLAKVKIQNCGQSAGKIS